MTHGAKAKPPAGAPRRGKAAPPPSVTQHETPIFCFRYADRRSRNKWAFKLSEKQALRLVTFLCEMAGLSWRQIEEQSSGGHRMHHNQALDSINRDAQKDAERAGLGETFGDTMFRFRLGSKLRLWGFRQDRVFHAVWWDADHKVYPTEPS